MKLYTVKEAAKLIGVSTNTLYKYLDENKIHAARGSAIQGRFRIPESALEEFLGIKLSSPEPIAQTVSSPLSPGVSDPKSQTIPENQYSEPLENENTATLERKPPAHLPTKIARFLLILALLTILADLFISTSVSLPAQLSRLLFLLVMLLLAYGEGGYRRG